MWIDIGILIFLLLSLVRGYNKGLGKTIAHLAGWVIAIVGGCYLSGRFAEYLLKFSAFRNWFDSFSIKHLPESFMESVNLAGTEIFAGIISFVLIIIVIKILINAFFSLFAFVKKIPIVGGINKLLGAILGLAKGVIILWVISLIMIPLIAAADSSGLAGVFNDSYIVSALYDSNSLLKIF